MITNERKSKSKTKNRDTQGRKQAKDPEKLYQQSLARYLKATEGECIVGGTEQHRLESWLKIIVLVSRTTSIGRHNLQEQRKQLVAAKRIRLGWRTYKLKQFIHIVAFLKIRSSIGWRLNLWMRIVKKRIAVKRIFFLLSEVNRLHSGTTILKYFLLLRTKMLCAQRMVRDFLLCRQARLLLLSKKWNQVIGHAIGSMWNR
jgi:hypothetical protein